MLCRNPGPATGRQRGFRPSRPPSENRRSATGVPPVPRPPAQGGIVVDALPSGATGVPPVPAPPACQPAHQPANCLVGGTLPPSSQLFIYQAVVSSIRAACQSATPPHLPLRQASHGGGSLASLPS